MYWSVGYRQKLIWTNFKVAYYSILMKEISILKSVKLKQQDISSEVLVTAIDVKCNFTENQG